jgi:transposase
MNIEEFADFLNVLKIDPSKIYTAEEIAKKLNRSPRTVRGWIEIGIRRPVIKLTRFKRGGSPEILGKHLIEFLKNIQMED